MKPLVCRVVYACGAMAATDAIWAACGWNDAELWLGIFAMLYIFGVGLSQSDL